jgi:hypothetical protein
VLARQDRCQLRVDPERVQGGRIARQHTLGAVDPPGCTTGRGRRAGTTQEAGAATPCRSLPEPGRWPVRGGRAIGFGRAGRWKSASRTMINRGRLHDLST